MARPNWWDDPPDRIKNNPLLVELWRKLNSASDDNPWVSYGTLVQIKMDIVESYMPNELVYQFGIQQIMNGME